MANNHVQFRWSTKPTTEEIQSTIRALGNVSPKPVIKINVQMRDIPHGALEVIASDVWRAEHRRRCHSDRRPRGRSAVDLLESGGSPSHATC